MLDKAIPFVAAVDWGTSSFRLWLLSRAGAVLAETRSDEGMLKAMEVGFPNVLDYHLGVLSAPADLPVVICGMAGARQGWREAVYLDAPVALGDLVDHSVKVADAQRPVHILPGIAQRDPQRPDVMRGEETQLLGVVSRGHGSGIACLPGTHSKWVALEDGRVERFATVMTGEFFSVLAGHSILRLAVGDDPQVSADDQVFAQAVREACATPQEAMARLFAVRAGPLLSLRDPTEGAARLSGGLIGLELAAARSRFGDLSQVALVGAGRLGGLYRAALQAVDVEVVEVNADIAVRAGLHAAALALYK